MVTTRSADKQANIDGKPESLALRSKPEEDVVGHTPSVRLRTPRSSTKKVIQINIPVPKRAPETDADGSIPDKNVSDRDQDLASKPDGTLKTEIPDSQDSPLKVSKGKTQPDFIALEDKESTPKSRAGGKRKRQGTETPRSASKRSSKPLPEATGEHRRFGSQELLDDSQFTANIGENAPTKEPADVASVRDEEDDDEEAPEVVTTTSTTRARRSTRGRSAVQNKFETPRPKSATDRADGQKRQPEEEVEVTPAPVLKLDTSQEGDSTIVPDTQDSDDSAFVTARTTRHVDIFATPPGGTPQPASPMLDQGKAQTTTVQAVEQQLTLPTRSLSHSLAVTRFAEPESGVVQAANTRIALPVKASNRFEHYRRQMLLNRAGKGNKNGRVAKFALQQEWSSKRRKFLVGY